MPRTAALQTDRRSCFSPRLLSAIVRFSQGHRYGPLAFVRVALSRPGFWPDRTARHGAILSDITRKAYHDRTATSQSYSRCCGVPRPVAHFFDACKWSEWSCRRLSHHCGQAIYRSHPQLRSGIAGLVRLRQAKMTPAIDPATKIPYTIAKDGFHATYYEMV